MKGTRSRLIPNLVLKFPRKWPKSMWKSWGEAGQRVRLKGVAQKLRGSRKEVHQSARVPPVRSPGSYLPALPDHDVVAVPVADAQHVGGHTVAGAGEGELLDGPVQGLPGGTTPSHSLQPELRHPVPSSKSPWGSLGPKGGGRAPTLV